MSDLTVAQFAEWRQAQCADVWRAGWLAAQASAEAQFEAWVHACARIARDHGATEFQRNEATREWSDARWALALIRAMQPPAAITNPPGRASEGEP